ncbi:YceI family protein [Streptomyces auratus]|uniref:YceI family protein n=1 Tax=Streptomyces auratus AGR0001 TaxID=1160718 RepID=J1ZX74_9ACTN|nr:YceI family protein [Streptomyces auratus]QTZ93120.1 YceI family protein [Streptomyces auratus AGR0001]
MPNHTLNPAQPSTRLSDLSAGLWVLDATTSSVEIKHKSMWGLATIRAAFTKLSGEGEIGPDGSAHGTLTIEAASILSKQAKLDNHLRSADFFHVERYPTFTFTATGVVADGAGTAKVTGRLTVLGTTRPLSFTARATAAGPNDVTLSGEVAIDRNDFGMGWNKAGMIKGRTTVTLTTRFTHR